MNRNFTSVKAGDMDVRKIYEKSLSEVKDYIKSKYQSLYPGGNLNKDLIESIANDALFYSGSMDKIRKWIDKKLKEI